ncbi:ABC transporter ATP-binding protein [Paracoccus suum]|uniref:ABC transporter ATP-binding protein n=1 Tax=Paracoccus suum TaxID=2259340 RepID=UPI001F53FDEE|nr:ABC transporter ATP-binding protein [Paracoccus suum]
MRNATLRLEEREMVFVAGPNGAGKSTLLRAIAGVIPTARGSVHLRGRRLTGLSADRIVGAGVNLVPEGREIFGALSVVENLMLGTYLRRDRAAAREDLDWVLDLFPALRPRLGDSAGLLSGGQQQMLAIGRALMTRADLLIIDELSLGLAPMIVEQIYETLLRLRKERGLTFLIAEQSFARAVDVDARLILLNTGSIVRDGRARDLARDEALEQSYFGMGQGVA